MKKSVNKINYCEVCGNKELSSVLNLGEHPMCDDLVPVGEERVCNEYPIDIVYCSVCCTAHQKYQVPKQDLFPQTYHYRSRFTADVLNGMKGLVQRCEDLTGSLVGRKVLDVGCNDGSLLGFFREKGAITIGIEPTGACSDAKADGHITYKSFLTPEVASQVAADQGHPDLIVFTNVFAHIENLGDVLESLQCLMSPTTVIVIENHYLGAVLDGSQFDTFYHEHPRTYSYTSFLHIARSLGTRVSLVEFPSRYGGNIRVFLGPQDSVSSGMGAEAEAVLEREATFGEQFEAMRNNIEKWRAHKRKTIEAIVAKQGRISAKAFPGRAAILVKLLGLDTDLIAVVHEKPGSLKIGHYLPGTRIPIVSDDDLFSSGNLSRPLLNLAWHISSEIRSYMTRQGYTGQIVDILSPEDFT
jgi:hypothetical protein